jgi:UDP-N-acetylglucosamine--N-acetylmuramyl-(pentapeptide) pyrophosphoryl-undecaprenol N-acetylglucosamine transferase
VTVVFAGGGTGGHLYPAIAIADSLRSRARVTFVGSADRLEATIVPKAGYELLTIASRPLPRTPSLDLLRTIASNVQGTFESLRLLGAQRPDLVITTGGYVAFPVALAARIRNMLRFSDAPVVLLEPNAEPGLTNRLLAPIVDEVWGASEPPNGARGKYYATGVPIRSSLRRLPPRDDALARLGLDPSLRTMVVMGGSQGARSINDAVARLVETDALPAGWQILALTGEGDYQRLRGVLPHARPYLDDMADAYAAADLVLARAGASTLGELAALGKPSILVPYPFAAAAHQAANAARFKAAGAAVVLTDEELRAGRLPLVLAKTLDEHRLSALAQGAASLRGSDPLLAILARVEALVGRRTQR